MIQVQYFYYACITIGLFLLLLFSLLNRYYFTETDEAKKYRAEEYFTNVFLPSTFGIVLVAIGFLGLNNLSYDERKLSVLAFTTAILGSAFASTSIMLSLSRIRWAAD